ncbi:MAG TPA: iron ABC transporter permease, partial [Ktedonobacterales bacterium]|nr:iron ABC transporter permease [Ktedonobacterales bacterium]
MAELARQRESEVTARQSGLGEHSMRGDVAARASRRSIVCLRSAALPLLMAGLLVSVVLATAAGAVAISPLHTALVLLNATHLFHFPRAWAASDEVILLQLRLPRVAGAVVVGAALGMAGTLFQGLLRNPLADPLLLGTSSGAALGATIGFILPAEVTITWLGFGLVAALAFAGSLLAVALVYWLATHRGQTPVVTLLLAGVAVSAMLTAAQTLLITLNDRLGLRITALYLWIVGGVNVQSWTQVAFVCVLVLLGALGAVALAPALDAFALGEEMAAHIGLRVERAKLAIVALAALFV